MVRPIPNGIVVDPGNTVRDESVSSVPHTEEPNVGISVAIVDEVHIDLPGAGIHCGPEICVGKMEAREVWQVRREGNDLEDLLSP